MLKNVKYRKNSFGSGLTQVGENDPKYLRKGTKDVFKPCPRIRSSPEREQWAGDQGILQTSGSMQGISSTRLESTNLNFNWLSKWENWVDLKIQDEGKDFKPWCH